MSVTDADGQPVPLGRRRAALVAALTLARPHPVPVDHLSEVVWPDGPPATWRNTLQVHISWLRRTAGLDVVAASGGYHLTADADEVDVDLFRDGLARADALFDACRFDEESVTAGRLDTVPAASTAYRAALAHWRGDPLPEFEYEDWAQTDRVALSEQHLAGLTRLYRCELALGHGRDITPKLRELVTRLPLREDLWWLLIHALDQQQRPAEALEAWSRARRTLRDELGVDPGPRLRDLHQRLLRTPGLDRTSSPARAAVPTSFTSFVGRERELAEVTALLTGTGPRLVSLVGPGGVGKTRLAAECADRLGQLPVTWVALDGISDDGDVAPALAHAVGITAIRGDVTPELAAAASRPALWVLDNCEHVLDGARRVCSAVLTASAKVVQLTTSRESLRLRPEQIVHLDPLPIAVPAPPAGADEAGAGTGGETGDSAADVASPRLSAAGRLLRDRVHARGNRSLPDDALQRVAEAMDGLPLALELAAAALATVGVDDLLGDLGGSPGAPRLPAAEPAWTDGPTRHRGLRQSLEWSWRLLSPEEQSFLAALGTFAGSFDAHAASAVSGRSAADSAALLASLTERSMLVTEPVGDGASGRVRFRLLRIVRSFALAHLSDDDAAESMQRLIEHYLAQLTAGPVAGGLTVDLPPDRVEALLADRDSLRAAFTAALPVRAPDAARLACGLTMPWVLTGLWGDIEEMLEHAVRALADDGTGSQPAAALPVDGTSAELLFCQSFVAGNLGDHEQAVASARRAADLAARCGRTDLELLALALIVGSPHRDGATDDPSAAASEAASVGVSVGVSAERIRDLVMHEPSPGVRSVALLNLGIRAMLEDDPRSSVKLWLSALDEARRAGQRDLQAIVMGNLSEAALADERDQEAEAWAEGALRVCAQLPRSTTLTRIRANVGQSRLGLGDVSTADDILREVCAQAHASGDRRLALEAVLVLAAAAAASGDRERATVLSAGYAAHLRAQGGTLQPSAPVLIRRYDLRPGAGSDPALEAADGTLGAAVVRGASLSLDDLMAFAAASTAGASPSPAPAISRTPPRDAHV